VNTYIDLARNLLKNRLFWLLQIAFLPSLYWFDFWRDAEACLLAAYISIFVHEALHIAAAGDKVEGVEVTPLWAVVRTSKLPTHRALLSAASPLVVFVVGVAIYDISGNFWFSLPFLLHVFLLPLDLANLVVVGNAEG